ncbi:MAG TPA: rhodanese-like domain-containing protein [Bacteriovoracaceae bacterium]|nr:rhodanese-like domain-containing protein [Bacteriovoracaceae bacterium]
MEIAPQIVAEWKNQGKEFNLLDVRRNDERETASLGGEHIPLHELEARFKELDPKKSPWIVYCHHGVRSLYATQFLKFHGYDALSLRGGIEEWSTTIDPTVPRY